MIVTPSGRHAAETKEKQIIDRPSLMCVLFYNDYICCVWQLVLYSEIQSISKFVKYSLITCIERDKLYCFSLQFYSTCMYVTSVKSFRWEAGNCPPVTAAYFLVPILRYMVLNFRNQIAVDVL